MDRLRPRARLDWGSDAVPRAVDFGDVYYSAADGLAETRAVFLEGTGMPDIWRGRKLFAVGETGFGTGLNFLALWALWRQHRPPGAQLSVLSFEGFPLHAEDLAKAHARFPELEAFAARLRRQWPPPVRGTHILRFPEDGVQLTLVFDEILAGLRGATAQIDAWFLDGFAPAQNPDMWSPDVIREIARLSAPGARVASYTVAGAVRSALSDNGFAVDRKPGFARKKHRLEARFAGGGSSPGRAGGQALIIGAGIAGLTVAAALAPYGWSATVLDMDGTASGASGNPAGLVMPRLAVEETGSSRMQEAAYRYALSLYASLSDGFEPVGILDLATDEAARTRHAKLDAAGRLDALGTLADAAAASDRAGLTLAHGGIVFPDAGLLDPRSACRRLGQAADIRPGLTVSALRQSTNGWEAVDGSGTVLALGDVAVLAGGAAGAALIDADIVPIAPSRGQVVRIPATAESAALKTALTFGSYATPARGGFHLAGSTFEPLASVAEADRSVRAADTEKILTALRGGLGSLFGTADPGALDGRVAFRATTPDRMPAVGPVPDKPALLDRFAPLRHGRAVEAPIPTRPGLYAHMGLGARGLTTAPLSAALLAAQIAGTPWPLDRDAAAALDPARFLLRNLRKRKI
jgi:tRNA 5-methylaminomethyl-2-thiouridine biosynthesis bifunctional protein